MLFGLDYFRVKISGLLPGDADARDASRVRDFLDCGALLKSGRSMGVE
jgi:hypothetical protein